MNMHEAAGSSQRLILITGPSGAGRSTAIKALEDIGYEVIDNLPISFLERLLAEGGDGKPLAIGLDVRNRDFSVSGLIEVIDGLTDTRGLDADVLYLDCSLDHLQRRFSQTRRRHPLAPAETVQEGIKREIDLLAPIRARADILIDTTEMTPHHLREEVERWFAEGESAEMAISIQSFSYKRGVPRGVDMVFDVRFLTNPYWSEPLRSLDGRDEKVRSYVQGDQRFASFFDKVMGLALLLLPAYREEGKKHLSIAFGCTGGQHRSVTMAELLSKALAEHSWRVSIRHRELERRNGAH